MTAGRRRPAEDGGVHWSLRALRRRERFPNSQSGSFRSVSCSQVSHQLWPHTLRRDVEELPLPAGSVAPSPEPTLRWSHGLRGEEGKHPVPIPGLRSPGG